MLATFAVVQGVTIILGGPRRWAADAYRVALEVPGAPATWGALLVGAGVLALVGSLANRKRLVVAGHFSIAVWSLFFAGTFLKTAVDNPLAPVGTVWVYGMVAVACLVLAITYRK